ncbi:hypothetical protein [Bacteroides eggerthii]|nr:hypothetical protein [Bacteroides eggerthii]
MCGKMSMTCATATYHRDLADFDAGINQDEALDGISCRQSG